MARWLLSALLCGVLASIGASAFSQHPSDPREPLIYGICQKPFPAILSLDYPFCRARAWLSALEKASEFLPPLPARLDKSDLPPKLERLAVCALVCPLDVVTPEIAAGNKIRVFLHWPPDPGLGIETALRESDSLLLEMAIIQETKEAVERLSHLWPTDANRAHQDLPQLEAEANLLRSLWDRVPGPNEKSLSSLPALLSGANAGSHTEAELIEPALQLVLTRETSDPANAGLWRRLAAYLLFSRGLALEERPGLAETDFGAALARLQNAPAEKDLQIRILLARARLYRARHAVEAMCADYFSACSLGKCQELSLARREGYCLNSQQK